MMLCQEWALVKRLNPAIVVIPLYCKCWTCEVCRPRRKARLVREAKAGAPTKFVTLTTWRRAGYCPHAAARALVRAWRQVRREYLEAHGKGSMPFLAVFEATKSGWPHLHIVVRSKWIDQRWLSKRMGELIGAPIVDVRKVKGVGEVARYVAKYIGKNPERFEGTKRYWRSLDYLFPEADTDEIEASPVGSWEVVEMHWLAFVHLYQLQAYAPGLGYDPDTYWPRAPP